MISFTGKLTKKKYYISDKLLGQGSFARVFKGYDESKNEYAIRLISFEFSKYTDVNKFLRLLQREIDAAKTLFRLSSHPNLVKIYDYSDSLDGPIPKAYFVTELCNGSLDGKSFSKDVNGKKIPTLDFWRVARDIATGVKVLHDNDIIHRDLKPANLLSKDGTIKLTDYGFLKQLSGEDDMAQTGLGTYIYMAPEIIKGKPYSKPADIFSLCILFFELITNTRRLDPNILQDSERDWLFKRLSCQNPSDRDTIEKVLSHINRKIDELTLEKVNINYVDCWTGALKSKIILWHPERTEMLCSKIPGLWLDGNGNELILNLEQISNLDVIYHFPDRPKNQEMATNSGNQQKAVSALAAHLKRKLPQTQQLSVILSHIQAPIGDFGDRIELGLNLRSTSPDDTDLKSCHFELDTKLRDHKFLEAQLAEAKIALEVLTKKYEEICRSKTDLEIETQREIKSLKQQVDAQTRICAEAQEALFKLMF